MGQTTCIGIGGDPLIGTSHIDALKLFAADPDTDAVIMIGEIGGTRRRRSGGLDQGDTSRSRSSAFIAGQTAPPGRRMGHAGAIIAGGKGTAAEKMAALTAAGVKVVKSPADMGRAIKSCLTRSADGPGSPRAEPFDLRTRRGMPEAWYTSSIVLLRRRSAGKPSISIRRKDLRMSPTDLAVQEQQAARSQQRVVNDFSIQIATVNGSGSQTANMVLLRSILLMGVPVSGKNMFPSNIAGLPTWYTIRASKRELHRAQEGSRLPRRDEPGDGEGRRADARAGRRGRLRRAAEAQRAAQRPGVLPGAVRQAGQAGLSRREAAPPRAQHDLRRHPREAARHRPRR